MPQETATLFGHPRGLLYLAFTEAWERFSYYGMTALLSLYMVGQLLTPGHAEHVLGLAGLRALLEGNGPMSDQAFASLIYGWYGGLVYFTPLLGGIIADRLLGTKATVVLGALLMSAGHFFMAFDASFLIALGLLILGSGCLKGNISAQVGQLYPVACGIAAHAGLCDLLRRHKYRLCAGTAGLRRGCGSLWLARRLHRCRRADDRRAAHLSGRAAPSARRPPPEAGADRLPAAEPCRTPPDQAAVRADRDQRPVLRVLFDDLEYRRPLGRPAMPISRPRWAMCRPPGSTRSTVSSP